MVFLLTRPSVKKGPGGIHFLQGNFGISFLKYVGGVARLSKKRKPAVKPCDWNSIGKNQIKDLVEKSGPDGGDGHFNATKGEATWREPIKSRTKKKDGMVGRLQKRRADLKKGIGVVALWETTPRETKEGKKIKRKKSSNRSGIGGRGREGNNKDSKKGTNQVKRATASSTGHKIYRKKISSQKDRQRKRIRQAKTKTPRLLNKEGNPGLAGAGTHSK